MRHCLICENESVFPFVELYDDRHSYPGLFQIMKCQSCGHKSLQAEFSPKDLTRMYTEFYPRSLFILEEYHPYKEVSGLGAWLDGTQNSAFRWVPKNVRVLDIGCGFGESLGYHKSRGCDVYGVEADVNIRRVADRFGYKVHVGLFDPKIYEPDFFDYVTLDQVIEHVTNPVEMLRDITGVMKPGGMLIIGTPNSNGWGAKVFGRHWIHWHTPYHLQLFSKKSMKLATEKAGLALEDVKTITNSYWLYLQWVHLLLRPDEGEPSVLWNPGIKRSRAQERIITMMTWMHQTRINHVISRIFDALGVGDNYLFFLRKKS